MAKRQSGQSTWALLAALAGLTAAFGYTVGKILAYYCLNLILR